MQTLSELLTLEDKLKLNDLNTTLELRKDSPCVILLGINTQRLGTAFIDFLASSLKQVHIIKNSSVTPLTDIAKIAKQEKQNSFFILDLFSQTYTQEEQASIIANLLFYRDYIGELGLKIIVVAQDEFLKQIYTQAYDFVSFNNFMAYFEDSTIELGDKNTLDAFQKEEEAYRQSLKNHPNMPVEIKMQKLDYLAKIAERTGKYAISLKYFNELLALAKKKKNYFFIASALHGKSIVYGSMGDFKKALDSLNQAEAIAKQKQDKDNIIVCMLSLASIYLTMCNFEKAITVSKKALESSNANTLNYEIELYAIDTIIFSLIFVSRFQEALNCWENIKDKYSNSKHLSDYKLIQAKLSIIKSIFMEDDDAIIILKQIIDNTSLHFPANICMANIYFNFGDFNIASMHLKYLLDGLAVNNNPWVFTDALLKTADIYFEQNKSLDAFKKYKETEAICEKHKNLINLCICKNQLSNYYIYINDLTIALSYAKSAQEIANKVQSPEYIAKSMLSIGKVHLAGGDANMALEQYTNALKIFEDIGHIQYKTVTQSLIAKAYFKLGNNTKAKEYAQSALEKFKNAKYQLNIAECLITLGLITKAEQSLQSKAYFIEAREIIESGGFAKLKCELDSLEQF